MPQDIGNLLERAAVPDQAAGQRVTQQVRTGIGQTSPSAGTADYVLNPLSFDRDATRFAAAQKTFT